MGQQYTWNGGSDGSWTDPNNWIPNGVPGAQDTVLFATGGSETVTGGELISGIAVQGDLVTFDGQIFQTDGATDPFLSATAGSGITIDANAYLDGGTIALDATNSLLTVNGTLIGTGGGTADAAVVQGITASWTEGAAVTLTQLYLFDGGTYTGDLVLNDGGSVTLDTAGNLSGGTLSATGNATVYMANASGDTTGAASVTEAIVTAQGFLSLGADAGVTASFDGPISGAATLFITGAGGAPDQSGTVLLDGDNSFTGGIVVQSGRVELGSATAAAGGPVFLTDSRAIIDSGAAGGNFLLVCGPGTDAVAAQAGHALVYGPSSGLLAFVGGTESSTVHGAGGIVFATGGSAGDLIIGGTSGQDQLYSGTGPTTLVGGANGGNLVATGTGAELAASGGNTTLNGAAGTNTLFFGAGSGATDAIQGAGTDVFVGGAGAATVAAGTGVAADWLGTGASELDFTNGMAGGTSYVYGFAGADLVRLIGYGAGEAQNAIANETISGGNTTIALSDNTHIEFVGVSGLSSGSFV